MIYIVFCISCRFRRVKTDEPQKLCPYIKSIYSIAQDNFAIGVTFHNKHLDTLLILIQRNNLKKNKMKQKCVAGHANWEITRS